LVVAGGVSVVVVVVVGSVVVVVGGVSLTSQWSSLPLELPWSAHSFPCSG
jgi:hypothetical protein